MPRNYVEQAKIDTDFGWLNNSSENNAKYLQCDGTGTGVCTEISADAKVSLPPGYRLVRKNKDASHFEVALLCDVTKEVVYFISCSIWEDVVLNAKPVTQVMLWRTSNVKHRKVTSGITEEVFRNYLLESYNVIASDNCQTREGRDFWVRQIGYALVYGEFVYRYDRMNSQLQPITEHASVRDNSCDLWGDDEKYENILAIISKEAIAA